MKKSLELIVNGEKVPWFYEPSPRQARSIVTAGTDATEHSQNWDRFAPTLRFVASETGDGGNRKARRAHGLTPIESRDRSR